MQNKYLRFCLLILTTAYTTIACTTTGSAVKPVGTLPSPPASKPGSTTPTERPLLSESSRAWTITGAAQARRYISTTNVALELSSDSGPIRDQLTEHTNFTLLTGTASGSTSFLGSIDAHSVETGTRIGPTEIPQPFPISFTGHIINGTVVLDALNGQTVIAGIQCINPALSTLSTIQRNIVLLPSQLSTGMSWKDSTTSVGCSGTVPLLTVSVRTYKVIGKVQYTGQTAILLERSDSITSTGEGSRDQHRVLIRSDGTGTGRVYLDHITGALLDFEGEMKTTVVVTMGKSQRFTQTVREKTTVAK